MLSPDTDRQSQTGFVSILQMDRVVLLLICLLKGGETLQTGGTTVWSTEGEEFSPRCRRILPIFSLASEVKGGN